MFILGLSAFGGTLAESAPENRQATSKSSSSEKPVRFPKISAKARANLAAYKVMYRKAPQRVKNTPTKLPNPAMLARSGKPKVIKANRDRLWSRLNPKKATRAQCDRAFKVHPLGAHTYEDVSAVMYYGPKSGDIEAFVVTALIESRLESYWSYGPKKGQRKAGDDGHSHGIFQLNDQGRLKSYLGGDVARAYIPMENARVSALEFSNIYYHTKATGPTLALKAQRPAHYSRYTVAYNERVPWAWKLINSWKSNCTKGAVVV